MLKEMGAKEKTKERKEGEAHLNLLQRLSLSLSNQVASIPELSLVRSSLKRSGSLGSEEVDHRILLGVGNHLKETKREKSELCSSRLLPSLQLALPPPSSISRGLRG